MIEIRVGLGPPNDILGKSQCDNHQGHALTGSQASYPGPNSVGYQGKHMSEARALMERKSRAR
jgi:hypothetical protein